MSKGSILGDVDEQEQSRTIAIDWWLFRNMSAGEGGERVELERGESRNARRAWRAYEVVQRTIDDGGDEAIRIILALLGAASGDDGVVAVGTGPLEDLINDHGDDLVDLVDLVEQTARRTPGFAASLGSVAVEEGILRPETVDRLARWLPAP